MFNTASVAIVGALDHLTTWYQIVAGDLKRFPLPVFSHYTLARAAYEPALHIRVIGRHTGQLIRELTLDPTRDYQPQGLPPGPPKKTAVTPRPASRSRPPRATAAGVKAGRRPPTGPRP